MKVYQLRTVGNSLGNSPWVITTFVCNDDVLASEELKEQAAKLGYSLREYGVLSAKSSEDLYRTVRDEICADLDQPLGEWPEVEQ
jgi:hypothetical protein